jgi:hypothetical protein
MAQVVAFKKGQNQTDFFNKNTFVPPGYIMVRMFQILDRGAACRVFLGAGRRLLATDEESTLLTKRALKAKIDEWSAVWQDEADMPLGHPSAVITYVL